MDTFSNSLWSAITPSRKAPDKLATDIDIDILICGGGFMGLSTALHLAQLGVSVAIAEANEVGFGASGRNTGFVVPSLKTAIGPDDVARRLGANFAERLVDLVGSSGNTIFDVVRSSAIECAAEQTGWLQPAHSKAMLTTLERRAREWRRLGKDVEMLDHQTTAERVGAPGYLGALLVPSGGQLNPLAYARGLADRCTAAGVRIFENTKVVGFERRAAGWRARTPMGDILAKRVLLATNGLIGNLVPEINASIIPARVFQIATQIYDREIQSGILPTRTPVADTRRHTFAVRWSPDGRLMTGGIVIIGPRAMERAKVKFAERLTSFFPMIPRPKAEYSWTGTIAVTIDSYPRFLSVAPDMDAIIGCNGRGVALTTALGRSLAHHYVSQGADAFPLPKETPQAIPMRRFAELAPSLWLPWSEFLDARESARSKQATHL